MLAIGLVVVIGGAAAITLNPESSQQLQGETTYQFKGEMTVIEGSGGITFDESSFQYTTPEDTLVSGLNFIGPGSSLSLFGVENVRFDWKLVGQDNNVRVDPPTQRLSDISSDSSDDILSGGENARINLNTGGVPAGTYDLQVESFFQCGTFSPECTGESSFSTTVEIPKGTGGSGSEVIN